MQRTLTVTVLISVLLSLLNVRIAAADNYRVQCRVTNTGKQADFGAYVQFERRRHRLTGVRLRSNDAKTMTTDTQLREGANTILVVTRNNRTIYEGNLDWKTVTTVDWQTKEVNLQNLGIRVAWSLRRKRTVRIPEELSKQIAKIPSRLFRRLSDNGFLTFPSGTDEGPFDLSRLQKENSWSTYSTPDNAVLAGTSDNVFEVLHEQEQHWVMGKSRFYRLIVVGAEVNYQVSSSLGSGIYRKTLELMLKTLELEENRRGSIVLATFVSVDNSGKTICTGLDIVDDELRGREPTTDFEEIPVELSSKYLAIDDLAGAKSLTFELRREGLNIEVDLKRNGPDTFVQVPGGTFRAREKLLSAETGFELRAIGRSSRDPEKQITFRISEDTRSIDICVQKPGVEVVLQDDNRSVPVPLADVNIYRTSNDKEPVSEDELPWLLLRNAWNEEPVMVELKDRQRKKVEPEYSNGEIKLKVDDPAFTMNRFVVVYSDGIKKPAAGWNLRGDNGETKLTPDGKVESRELKKILKGSWARLEPPAESYFLQPLELTRRKLTDSDMPLEFNAEFQTIGIEPNLFRGFCPAVSVVQKAAPGEIRRFKVLTSESDDPAAKQQGAIYELRKQEWVLTNQHPLELPVNHEIYFEPLGIRSQGATRLDEMKLRIYKVAANTEDERERLKQLNTLFPDTAGIDVVVTDTASEPGPDYQIEYLKGGKTVYLPLLRSALSAHFFGTPLPSEDTQSDRFQMRVYRNGQLLANRDFGSSVFISAEEDIEPPENVLAIHVVIVNGERSLQETKDIWSFLRISLARALGKAEVPPETRKAVVAAYLWAGNGGPSMLQKLTSVEIDLLSDARERMKTAYSRLQGVEPLSSQVGHGRVDAAPEVLADFMKDVAAVNDDRVIVFEENDKRNSKDISITVIPGRKEFLERVLYVRGISGYLRREQGESYYHEKILDALTTAIRP